MKLNDITIREAATTDFSALHTLLLALRADLSLKATDYQDLASYFEACVADNRMTILVAESRTQIVGYISVQWLPHLIIGGTEGFISELFVHPEHRGGGIGTHLLESVTSVAQKRGSLRLHLVNLRTRASYRRAFYPKRGWVERKQVSDFVYPVSSPEEND